MTKSPYKRFSRVLRRSYPSIVATVALVIALVGVPGVTAGGLLVTSKQIKNNSITSADLRKSAVKTSDLGTNAVRSADIQSGAVQSAEISEGAVSSSDIGQGEVSSGDIGSGEVTPEDVSMPDPSQLKFDGTVALEPPSLSFQKVTDLGTYAKQDPSSALEVTWTGSIEGHNGGAAGGCVFQLRVDGVPAPHGGGEVFGVNIISVSSSALFPNLAAGPHQIEVWAKITVAAVIQNSCTVGPPKAGIGQTVVVAEQVL